jgi:exosome complex RNA-binding protein Rrp42 (RNase PH superfamily)
MEEFVKEYLNQGKRIDGRGLKDYRSIEIKHYLVLLLHKPLFHQD